MTFLPLVLAALCAQAQEKPAVQEIPTGTRLLMLGVGAGIRGYSSQNELGVYDRDPLGSTSPANGVALDLRAAVRPISRVWLEPEASVMPTKTRDGNAQIFAADVGANALFDVVVIEDLTLFAMLGAGALIGSSSDELVLQSDTDTHTRGGVGARYALTETLGLRSDARLILPAGSLGDFAGAPDFKASVGLYTMVGPQLTRKIVDHDLDGLFAPEDRCPRSPEDADGFEDTDGCPDEDNDEDGIADVSDSCPDVPEVVNGIADEDGCPELDADGDGFFDEVDSCVREPETVNGYEDSDGCPDEIPEEVKAFTGVIEGIRFDLASANLRSDSHEVLDRAVVVLLDFESTRVEISGHTDDQGSAEYNLDLSQRRANSVRDYFIGKGVAPERLVARGYGFERPIAEGVDGRSENRRVEFNLISLEQE